MLPPCSIRGFFARSSNTFSTSPRSENGLRKHGCRNERCLLRNVLGSSRNWPCSATVSYTFLIPVEQSVPVAGPRGKLKDHARPRRVGQNPTPVVFPPNAAHSPL